LGSIAPQPYVPGRNALRPDHYKYSNTEREFVMKTPEVKIQVQTETDTKSLSGEFCAGIVVNQTSMGTGVNQYCIGALSLSSTVSAINCLKDLAKILHDSFSPEEQGALDLMLVAKSSAKADPEVLPSNPEKLQTEESDSSPNRDKVLRAIIGGMFGGKL